MDKLKARLISSIGAKVGHVRQQRQPVLTQSALAAKADLTRAAISSLEKGRGGISVVALCRIASALEISPGRLLPDLEEFRRLQSAVGSAPEARPAKEIAENYLAEQDE